MSLNLVQIEGSSKKFFATTSSTFLMAFKDDMHGRNQQKQIPTSGSLRKEFTYYFYRLLEKYGVATHLALESNALSAEGVAVQRCQAIKIEVLVRNVARGHWVDQHKIPIFQAGAVFSEPVVEFCLKEKLELENGQILDDPRITPQIAVELNTLSSLAHLRGSMLYSLDEAREIEAMALKINAIYRDFLQAHEWILEDFKFEVGRSPITKKIILIDEISPDCSRIRDQSGASLSKDLFRERKSEMEIIRGYTALRDAIKILALKSKSDADH